MFSVKVKIPSKETNKLMKANSVQDIVVYVTGPGKISSRFQLYWDGQRIGPNFQIERACLKGTPSFIVQEDSEGLYPYAANDV
jgi:hypothetical protein